MVWIVAITLIIFLPQVSTFGFGFPGHHGSPLPPTTTPPLMGTCASRNYDTQCCPPRYTRETDCGASDGNCRCDAQCHWFEDCCDDVYCSAGSCMAD